MRRFKSVAWGVNAVIVLLLVLLGAASVDGQQRLREKSDDLIKQSLSGMLQRYDADAFQHPHAGQQGLLKTCYNYFIWYVWRAAVRACLFSFSSLRICDSEAYPSVQLNRFAFANGEAVAELSSLQVRRRRFAVCSPRTY